MGLCNCSMFCCTLLYVHSRFALICLSSCCLVIVVWLFLTVPRSCVQFVIVVFPDHTHYFCNHLDGEERAGCFAWFVFLASCGCCVALPRDAMGLSAVCDCGIS